MACHYSKVHLIYGDSYGVVIISNTWWYAQKGAHVLVIKSGVKSGQRKTNIQLGHKQVDAVGLTISNERHSSWYTCGKPQGFSYKMLTTSQNTDNSSNGLAVL